MERAVLKAALGMEDADLPEFPAELATPDDRAALEEAVQSRIDAVQRTSSFAYPTIWRWSQGLTVSGNDLVAELHAAIAALEPDVAEAAARQEP